MSARISPGRLRAGELHSLLMGAGHANDPMAQIARDELDVLRNERFILDDEHVRRDAFGDLPAGLRYERFDLLFGRAQYGGGVS